MGIWHVKVLLFIDLFMYLFVLAYSLSRLWRRTFYPGSRPLSARWRHGVKVLLLLVESSMVLQESAACGTRSTFESQ